MKSTSPSSRRVRMAARSPARSSAGPEVMCRPTSISAATMPARVVLPRPGGPAKSRWSAAWPRRRAASRMMPRCSLSSRWPTNSSRWRGRRPPSSPIRSAPDGPSAVGRGQVGQAGLDVVGGGLRREQLVARHQAAASCCRARRSSSDVSPSGGQLAQGLGDLVGAVAEAGERVADVGRGDAGPRPAPGPRRHRDRRPPRRRRGRGCRGGDLSSTSRRAAVFLPTPGTRHSAARSSSASTRRSEAGGCTDEDGQGQRGPDAVGAEQRLEARPARRR